MDTSAQTVSREAADAARKARDPKELAAYYEPGVEVWYAELATRGDRAVIVPGNHDHNFRLLAFLSSFEAPPGAFHQLDVGCGAGLYAVSILLRHPKAVVTGVDISAKNLRAAARLAAMVGVQDRLRLIQADVNHLPVGSSFDTILCSEIVEHLPDPTPLLSRLRELATPETSIYVSVPHIDIKNVGDIMYVRVDEHGSKVAESSDVSKLGGSGRLQAYYHHLYTESEILALLERIGFAPDRVEGANIRFPPGYPWISYGLKTVFRSSRLDAWLNRITRRRYAGNLLVIAKATR